MKRERTRVVWHHAHLINEVTLLRWEVAKGPDKTHDSNGWKAVSEHFHEDWQYYITLVTLAEGRRAN